MRPLSTTLSRGIRKGGWGLVGIGGFKLRQLPKLDLGEAIQSRFSCDGHCGLDPHPALRDWFVGNNRAQQHLADEGRCGFPAQSGPVFNSSTYLNDHPPQLSRPAQRAAGDLSALAFALFIDFSTSLRARATHFANMSFVTRRALSTLIPPKVCHYEVDEGLDMVANRCY